MQSTTVQVKKKLFYVYFKSDYTPSCRYSGIHDGRQCLCASSLGVQSINDTCSLICASDNSRLCGGPRAVSVYETGFIGKCFLVTLCAL